MLTANSTIERRRLDAPFGCERIRHFANGVPLDCKRSARRTTIAGDYKVGRYLEPALDRDRLVKHLVD